MSRWLNSVTFLSGGEPGRSEESDITIADLTGLAAQDIAIARTVLDAFERKQQS